MRMRNVDEGMGETEQVKQANITPVDQETALTSLSLFEKLVCHALRCGSMPRHLAMILDGNRRFASKNHAPPITGHAAGSATLERTLALCFYLGINCVTVYAFAVDNFARPRSEVDGLMDLLREKLQRMAAKGQLVEKYGVRIRCLGERHLLPKDVQRSINEIEHQSQHNTGCYLNLCIAYSAKHEMVQAVDRMSHLVKKPKTIEQVHNKLKNKMLYTHNLPKIDVLVRTSGVNRLSDFLTYQTSTDNALVIVTETLWPDFGLKDLTSIVLQWQRQRRIK